MLQPVIHVVVVVILAVVLYLDFGRDRGANFKAKLIHSGLLLFLWQLYTVGSIQLAQWINTTDQLSFQHLSVIVLFVLLILPLVQLTRRNLKWRPLTLKLLPLIWIASSYCTARFVNWDLGGQQLGALVLSLNLLIVVALFAVYSYSPVRSFFKQFSYS